MKDREPPPPPSRAHDHQNHPTQNSNQRCQDFDRGHCRRGKQCMQKHMKDSPVTKSMTAKEKQEDYQEKTTTTDHNVQ